MTGAALAIGPQLGGLLVAILLYVAAAAFAAVFHRHRRALAEFIPSVLLPGQWPPLPTFRH